VAAPARSCGDCVESGVTAASSCAACHAIASSSSIIQDFRWAVVGQRATLSYRPGATPLLVRSVASLAVCSTCTYVLYVRCVASYICHLPATTVGGGAACLTSRTAVENPASVRRGGSRRCRRPQASSRSPTARTWWRRKRQRSYTLPASWSSIGP
jgi:hypothetical protein